MSKKESRRSPVCRNLGIRPKNPVLKLIADHKDSCRLMAHGACKTYSRYIFYQVLRKVETCRVPWQSDARTKSYPRTKITKEIVSGQPFMGTEKPQIIALCIVLV